MATGIIREESECFAVATGQITSLPKVINDARITHECVIMDEMISKEYDIGWITQTGKIILYGSLPTGVTVPSYELKVRRVHGLTAETVAISLRQQNSTSANGNWLVAEASGLTPGVQYSFRLYSVANNTDTYVYGIGTTVHYPTYNMWFQQVPRSLTDGTVYRVTVSPTANSSDVAASNTVSFVAAVLGGGVTDDPAENENDPDPGEEE